MIDPAHIHPMVVHFPIVLLMLAVAVQWLVLIRGGDLSAHDCLSNLTLATLALGALSAVVAAFFGDVALDKAVALGFPAGPLETHEAFGITTMSVFLAITAVQAFAWWRGIGLSGRRGWILASIGTVGVILLVVTAFFGGHLVYEIGVNVRAVHA
jgi:uncharacterized membrane protein